MRIPAAVILSLAAAIFLLSPQAFASEQYVVLPVAFHRVTVDKANAENYQYEKIDLPQIKPKVIAQMLESRLRRDEERVTPQDYFLKKNEQASSLLRRLEQVVAMVGARVDFAPEEQMKFQDYQVLNQKGEAPLLAQMPEKLTGTKLILPVGIEFKDATDNSVSAVLMVAVINEDSRITAISTKKYIPETLDVYQANQMFSGLMEESLKKQL